MTVMSENTWSAVDDYLSDVLLGTDPVLDATVARADAAGLPSIQVSATQGKQLMLLARAIGARRVLEVGTLGGYSAIWLARGLPADGHLDTCEIDPTHAETARASLAEAGLADRVTVHLGPAADTIARLTAEGVEAYDLAFIDADKQGNADYVRATLALSHPGTLIVVDNVVRNGGVVDPANEDPSVVGTRRLFDYLATEPRLDATAIQTVGHKGYDGFALALVNG
jgi:predicted O-methyltransferase YrrM